MKRIYGSSKSIMDSGDDEDPAVKCRERRRRRITIRRMASASSGDKKHNSAAHTASAIMNFVSITETPPMPVYGMMSVIGRQRDMEDEVSVRLNLCRPEINKFQPVHFFGVFDGHGGRHISTLCKEHMHLILEKELMRVTVDGGGGELTGLWRSAINRSFQRIDEMALRLCLCGGGSTDDICRCSPQLSFMGSTAVVSILTTEHIFVANCGDSRAVLCRNGSPLPLSVDHKPDRENERTRIEGRGGRIMFSDGARVEGILGMSRAIGDRLLKQWVVSEPEISITRREAGDECLILASDGLWDVVSSELACKIARECLHENGNSSTEPRIETDEEASTGEGLFSSRSESAAALLVRLALGRRSTDNISVIVIDLK